MPRASIEPLEVTKFTSLDHMTLVARYGMIVDASASGFLIRIRRTDLVPKDLRESLSLQILEGDRVLLSIAQMNLEMAGRITRATRVNKEYYDIAIDYSEDAPEYWRECLMDLLPKPGEFDK